MKLSNFFPSDIKPSTSALKVKMEKAEQDLNELDDMYETINMLQKNQLMWTRV